MKQPFAVILGTTLLMSSLATVTHANRIEDKYFTNDNPKLTQQGRRALAIAQRWKAGGGNGGIRPFTGRNGAIQFVFGAQSPSVVCAVLHVCDIALQPGEYVNSIQLGDTARWNIEPAISGTGESEVHHLLIKPLDVGLETSLVVTTDRRVYHIRLRSHRTEYMPQVTFTYPEYMLTKWDKVRHEARNRHHARERERQKREGKKPPETREYLDDLSFAYDMSGSADWKPVSVFNDGHKTIIQMPEAMRQTEAPTLLVIRGWRFVL